VQNGICVALVWRERQEEAFEHAALARGETGEHEVVFEQSAEKPKAFRVVEVQKPGDAVQQALVVCGLGGPRNRRVGDAHGGWRWRGEPASFALQSRPRPVARTVNIFEIDRGLGNEFEQ